jgi:hypothetical protein
MRPVLKLKLQTYVQVSFLKCFLSSQYCELGVQDLLLVFIGSDAVFDPSQCYPVASFSDLGISDTLLTKGLLNDIALASLLNVNLKDQSHINRQEPTNDTSLGGASFLNANLKDQSHLNWQEHMNETSPVAGLLNANLEEQSHLNWQEPKNESSPEAGFLNANLEEQSHLNWPLQECEPWIERQMF